MVPVCNKAGTMSRWLDFSGRISRRQFWRGYVLPLFLLMAAALALEGLARLGGISWTAEETGMGPLSALVVLVALLAGSCACVKRLHDLNCHGGWLLLTAAVPGFGQLLAVLLLGSLPGTPAENDFGAPPLA
jgi:uncharacterized membrane protein YhaH (DUF805 family)